MNIRILISLMAILCLLCSCISSSKQRPNEASQSKVQKSTTIAEITGKYKKIERVDDLPPIIIDRLRSEDKNCPGVANPSEDYNPGCGAGYGDLPCRKLLSGGTFNNIWFIEYLTGGAASVRTFTAFRLEDNHIVSLLSYGFLDVVSNHGSIKLSTRELSTLLPLQAICSDKNQAQYIIEIKYGLCELGENSFYQRFIPK